MTGQLGEVMRESAKIAQSYICAHAPELGVDPEKIKNNGVHVHVPAGAIPKDLRDLADHVRAEMQFHFVDRVEQVLSIAIPNLQMVPLLSRANAHSLLTQRPGCNQAVRGVFVCAAQILKRFRCPLIHFA